MNVRELIERLSEFDGDTEVAISTSIGKLWASSLGAVADRREIDEIRMAQDGDMPPYLLISAEGGRP